MEDLNEIVSEERILKAVDLLSSLRKSGGITLEQYDILIKPTEMSLNYHIQKDNDYYHKKGK